MQRQRLATTTALVITLAAAGCDDGRSACDDALVGEREEQPVLELVTLLGDSALPLSDGGDCPLVLAPQGGHIVPVAARASNLAAGQVQLTGWLTDPTSGQVLGLESRPAVLVDGGDGWAVPERPDSLASFANIAACPSLLPRDVHDQPWLLELRVEDCAGRSVESQVTVTPRCSGDHAAFCACECDADYRLGDPCPAAIPL